MPLPLYQQIADQLAEQLRQQVYLPGEKIPSIRRLATQHQVSVPTVRQALLVLEQQLLIEARPRSGYLVRQQVSHSPLLETAAHAPQQPAAVSVHGRAISIFQACEQAEINLGTAYPDISLLPVRSLQTLGRKLLGSDIEGMVQGRFSHGLELLRHQLAQRMAEAGCELNQDELIVTNGCQEALSLCLQVTCQPGDMVAIESPAFVGVLQLIEALGLKALEIPCDPQSGLSLAALQLALEQWPIKALLVTPSFSNPLGALMSTQRRKQLLELVAPYDIPVIEDDLFGDLGFEPGREAPLKALDSSGRVLYCSSLSKSVAPGFRTGWIAAGRYHQQVAKIKSFTNVSATAMPQYLVGEFMSSGRYTRHLRSLRQQLSRRVQQVQHWLGRYFPDKTRWSTPRGGYVLWVQLPRGLDSWQLYQAALAAGIGIVPGPMFSASDKFGDYIRINCAAGDNLSLELAIRRLGELTERLLRQCD